MSTIKYAVLVKSDDVYQVNHIYQHVADAERCAAAYQTHLAMEAFVAEMFPPLTVVRQTDTWGIYIANGGILWTYPSHLEAIKNVRQGDTLLTKPIRQAMPIQHGIPQFSTGPTTL